MRHFSPCSAAVVRHQFAARLARRPHKRIAIICECSKCWPACCVSTTLHGLDRVGSSWHGAPCRRPGPHGTHAGTPPPPAGAPRTATMPPLLLPPRPPTPRPALEALRAPPEGLERTHISVHG